MLRFLSFLLLFATFMAEAEVYTWINEHGVRVYGDKPPEHAKKAKLPKIQSLPEVKAPPSQETKSQSTQSNGFAGYQQFEVLTPEEEQIIHFGESGNVNIQLQLHPALQIGHKVTLLLNGKPMKTAPALQFQLDSLNRGSYLIQAQVKHQGRLLISTPKRRIHVQRPSILNRPRTQ